MARASLLSRSEITLALLFSKEALFESYIATELKKMIYSGYALSVQDKTCHLFDEPRKFLMNPDIIIRNKALGQVFVIETKQKALSDAKANYGNSQSDIYQMYAYQKKYTSENVILLYSLTERAEQDKNIEFLSHDGAQIKVRFV